MKTFIVESYAKTGAVRAAEWPVPTIAADELLVRVMAAGVNPLDSKLAAGEFKLVVPYEPPFVLGHDVAGVVEAVGAGVTGFSVGDAVFARPRDLHIGTFAELVAVKADDAALKPSSISFEEAASMPLVALTAWQVLVDVARVSAGQKVLVHAGSGGVGTIAIQLAKHLGATVATTAGPANTDLVTSLGADVVVDHHSEDFAEVLSGYDVVIDPLGEESVLKSLTVLRRGGLVVSLGGPPLPEFARAIGAPAIVPLVLRVISRKVRRRARRLGVGYAFHFMTADGDQLARIARLVDDGTVRPVVDRVLSFDDTLGALALVDSGRVRGKVVVTHS